MKSLITTHVLDTARGCPARGVPARLLRLDTDAWSEIATGLTDEDGRIMQWLRADELSRGRYKIVFDTSAYLADAGFFAEIAIDFTVKNPKEHHHVPLLLSPFGYSTYRGS